MDKDVAVFTHVCLYIILQGHSVEWKRKAFFKFVDIFHDTNWPQELKARVSTAHLKINRKMQ